MTQENRSIAKNNNDPDEITTENEKFMSGSLNKVSEIINEYIEQLRFEFTELLSDHSMTDNDEQSAMFKELKLGFAKSNNLSSKTKKMTPEHLKEFITWKNDSSNKSFSILYDKLKYLSKLQHIILYESKNKKPLEILLEVKDSLSSNEAKILTKHRNPIENNCFKALSIILFPIGLAVAAVLATHSKLAYGTFDFTKTSGEKVQNQLKSALKNIIDDSEENNEEDAPPEKRNNSHD